MVHGPAAEALMTAASTCGTMSNAASVINAAGALFARRTLAVRLLWSVGNG
jgi:hypothetical protein